MWAGPVDALSYIIAIAVLRGHFPPPPPNCCRHTKDCTDREGDPPGGRVCVPHSHPFKFDLAVHVAMLPW